MSRSGLTSSRPKTMQRTRNIMQTREQEVAAFEMKYAKKVDEDAKIWALKSLMPETLFGEASIVGRKSFNFCADLCAAIITYMDDKVPVSMMKQGPPMSTTNMIQTLSAGDQGE